MEAEQAHDSTTIVDALNDLHRAGWSVGVVALSSLDGSSRVVWQVDGSNDENFIRGASGWISPEARQSSRLPG
jgi:hypothetical protein